MAVVATVPATYQVHSLACGYSGLSTDSQRRLHRTKPEDGFSNSQNDAKDGALCDVRRLGDISDHHLPSTLEDNEL